MSIPSRIRAARAAIGLSQAAIAKNLGIDRSALSRYETGTDDLTPKVRDRLIALLARKLSTAGIDYVQLVD